jgi:chromosomal replication initiation ATPase DnaA
MINQMPKSDKFAPVNDVINSACIACVISRIDFETKKRTQNFVIARMLTANYLLKYHRYTLKKIGDICGKKDHATVLHYKRNFIKFIDTNDPLLITALNLFNQQLLIINDKYKLL